MNVEREDSLRSYYTYYYRAFSSELVHFVVMLRSSICADAR